jgi:hypothetical protein
VQPGQGDPVRGDRGRQQFLHVGISVTGQRGHRHGVKARVLAGRRADVGVRVDPHDRQVIAVPAGELGKGRDAYRALPAEGGDPRRIMLTDDLQGARELPEDDRLGLDAVAFLQALVAEGDGGRVATGPWFGSRIAARTAEPTA